MVVEVCACQVQGGIVVDERLVVAGEVVQPLGQCELERRPDAWFGEFVFVQWVWVFEHC